VGNKKNFIYSLGTTLLFSIPLSVMLLSGIFLLTDKAGKDLEILAEETGLMLGSYLDQYKRQVQILALNPVLSDPDLRLDRRLGVLESYAATNRPSSIYLADLAGTGRSPGGTERDFRDDPYFRGALAGETLVSNPVQFPGDSASYMETVSPLYWNKLCIGALIQYTDWREITSLIDTLNLEKGGFAYLRDRNGAFSTHPDPAIRSNQLSPPRKNLLDRRMDRLYEIKRHLIAGDSGSGSYWYRGREKIMGFAPVPGTTWSIGISIFRSEILVQGWLLLVLYAFLLLAVFLATLRYQIRRSRLREENGQYLLELQEANAKLSAQRTKISELADARIQETEDLYRNLFDFMTIGVFLYRVTDMTDRGSGGMECILANEAAARMSGTDRTVLKGRSPGENFPLPEGTDSAALHEITGKKEMKDLGELQTSDGMRLRCSAFSPRDGQLALLYNDVTESVKAAREQEEERNRLLQAIRSAEETNSSKDQFLANMNQEFRSPLNAILDIADKEMAGRHELQTVQGFSLIRDNVRSLISILNDIADFSGMRTGKANPDRIEFQLERIVNNALRTVISRLNARKAEMLVDYDPDLPARIMIDPLRLWQILKNVLDHAAQATGTGKIILEIRKTYNGMLRFTVSDSVNADEQSGAAGPDTAPGHSGLGLTLARHLVDMMEGTLSISDAPGRGQVIHITLPLEAGPNSPELLSDDGKPDQFKDRRILVIEDDRTAQLIISKILERTGASVTCMASGTDALEFLSAEEDSKRIFDVVLIDFLMPGLNGIETAERISRQIHYKPKLLMVTAWSSLLEPENIMNAGFRDVIEKPFVPSQLLLKVRHVLEQQTAPPGWKQKGGHVEYPAARVLVVEDNPQNRDVLNRMLLLFGIKADTAHNGLEARNACRDNAYDLVFMDIQMPEQNGTEATRLIRLDEQAAGKKPVPIVAMSAFTINSDLRENTEAGMNDSIRKPIEQTLLKQMLEKYLPDKRALAGEPEQQKPGQPDAELVAVLYKLQGEIEAENLEGVREILAGLSGKEFNRFMSTEFAEMQRMAMGHELTDLLEKTKRMIGGTIDP
jgi:Signal transduction histidine kinase